MGRHGHGHDSRRVHHRDVDLSHPLDEEDRHQHLADEEDLNHPLDEEVHHQHLADAEDLSHPLNEEVHRQHLAGAGDPSHRLDEGVRHHRRGVVGRNHPDGKVRRDVKNCLDLGENSWNAESAGDQAHLQPKKPLAHTAECTTVAPASWWS